MTQTAAQYGFWNSFGIPAYPNTAVPKDPILPYMTYDAVSGYWFDIANPSVKIWYWTDNEAIPNAKCDEIARRIGTGITLPCDGGAIRVTLGTPFRLAVPVENENTLKLRALNIRMEFVVTDI